MKLILLILGLAIGFGGGIWYGINHPKEAADLNAKQEEWLRQGKEQALGAVRDALNQKLAQAQAAPAAPSGTGRNFSGFVAGGTGGAKSEADTLKDAKTIVEAQLTQVQAKK
jgi:hypothetical protein